MIYSHNSPGKSTGMCFINLSSYLYFVAFTPVVYFTFLSQFLGSKSIQPTLLFSYKAQVRYLSNIIIGSMQFKLQIISYLEQHSKILRITGEWSRLSGFGWISTDIQFSALAANAWSNMWKYSVIRTKHSDNNKPPEMISTLYFYSNWKTSIL